MHSHTRPDLATKLAEEFPAELGVKNRLAQVQRIMGLILVAAPVLKRHNRPSARRHLFSRRLYLAGAAWTFMSWHLFIVNWANFLRKTRSG